MQKKEEIQMLEKAIERFERAEKSNKEEFDMHGRPGADKRAEEYAMYAKWLKELKNLKTAIPYLENCKEEAKNTEWKHGIGFALSVIKDGVDFDSLTDIVNEQEDMEEYI